VGGVAHLTKKQCFNTPEFLGRAFVDNGPSPAGNPGQYLKCPLDELDTIHRVYSTLQPGEKLCYRADGGFSRTETDAINNPIRWNSSAIMPPWASRLTLEISGVRCERVQGIDRADAKASGFLPGLNGLESYDGQIYGNAQLAFRAFWDSMFPSHKWDLNERIWVYDVKRKED